MALTPEGVRLRTVHREKYPLASSEKIFFWGNFLVTFCEHCGSPAGRRRFCSADCREAFRRAETRREFIEAYGGKCQCSGGCDVTEPDFLSLDHIFRDGARHRRSTGVRGYAMYRLLKAQGWPRDRYRLLCHNCNMARAHFDRCPHERRLNPPYPANQEIPEAAKAAGADLKQPLSSTALAGSSPTGENPFEGFEFG